MAVGGALRAAIRAGRFGAAGRESRRQARALQSLNQGGGVGAQRRLPLEERGFERMSGMGYGATPRGNAVVVDPATGRRTVLPQNFDDFIEGQPARGRGPIEAPYEGMRTWPTEDGFPHTLETVPDWMGRGRAPHSRGTSLYSDYYGEELPSAFPRSLYDTSIYMNEPYGNVPGLRNTVPRGFFGGDAGPMPAYKYSSRPGPRFFFDDFGSGSPTAGLMGRVDQDPYLGFRTVRGFPFD